jgi:hypothetical protein
MNVMKDFANNDLKEEPHDGELQKKNIADTSDKSKEQGPESSNKAKKCREWKSNTEAKPRKSLGTASKRRINIRGLLFLKSEEELALCLELMEQSSQLFSWPSWKSKRDLVSLLANVIKSH